MFVVSRAFVSGRKVRKVRDGKSVLKELRASTFINLVLLLQTQIKESLVPVHDLVLELERHCVPGNLEETIVKAAVPHVVYEFLLRRRVIAVECFIRRSALFR